MKTLLAAAIPAAGAALAATGAALWANDQTRRFELKEVTVPILAPGALRGEEAFKILHVSDLHMIPGQRAKIDFVSGLAALRPHLVVNTGDNLSDSRAVPSVLQALGPLLGVPGVFCFGTNDYWAPKLPNPFNYLLGKKNTPSYEDLPWQGMRAAFVERGWQDATHQRLEFKVGAMRLAVSGVDDPHHHLEDYSAIAGAPNQDADLSLALLHSPEPRVLKQFAADGYQLSFSGHTHGGQLCLPPFMRRLLPGFTTDSSIGSSGAAIVTNCGIDRPRAQGLHDFDGSMKMHVSNGLGQSKFVPFRVFCRPSATLLKIVERPQD